ncbi:mannosyltransferase [Polaribacter glomeratus]|uniref:Mannosyltransferase n=1 Tax=Polaribacter glomeratus TaxID=102 RepID=A0A2S7WIY7_9FLAO|nr:mannosyltransferase [Polaribacter glomeratus]PQJ77281.1 mannosyltransferase [Polaribacter glomeratus]TXD65071.1 mannosyltransferase [Polaribacter glomeratus]
MSFFIKNKNVLLTLISTILYFLFAYFLERTEFYKLTFLWVFLFGCFYFLIKQNNLSFTSLAAISILFRLIFLFSIPNLSQDFYRFIWDGRMILKGFNPYLFVPEVFIQQEFYPISQASELYQGMGELNGSHFSNYPPLNQLCFLIAALFSSKSIFGSVIVLRLLIIFADIGILYFGKKLLETLNLPIKNIFWYALNPFVIIELTGNLHFEPVMIFFLIWALYKLQQQKWVLAAILIACSISVKLIPLLFLPLFYQWFVKTNISTNKMKQSASEKDIIWKFTQLKKRIPRLSELSKLFLFYSIVLSTTLLFFLPFYASELIANYTNSVSLWFKDFEFNASFYYLFREIGYLFRGYNEIAILGKILPILTILFLIVISLFRKNKTMIQLITALLFGLCFYYFTATTIHPWYLATPIILSVFTKYKFPIVWSLVVILSYQGYSNPTWKENLWIVAIEYSIVFSFLIYEIKNINVKKLTI